MDHREPGSLAVQATLAGDAVDGLLGLRQAEAGPLPVDRVPDLVGELRRLAAGRGVVLLDYTTNGDPSSPLSHAALVARYLTDRWPSAVP